MIASHEHSLRDSGPNSSAAKQQCRQTAVPPNSSAASTTNLLSVEDNHGIRGHVHGLSESDLTKMFHHFY
ncbi:MAG: hypothetical protein AB8E74_03255 [Prochlorococcus sp.]